MIPTERKARLWDDLKHVLETGTWSDKNTINEVLTSMSNMEYVVEKAESEELI